MFVCNRFHSKFWLMNDKFTMIYGKGCSDNVMMICVTQVADGFSWDTEVPSTYDDVIIWKHFPRYWPFVRGIHRSPVTRSFDGFFDLRLNQQWSKQWRRRWFETPPDSLWRHRNKVVTGYKKLGINLIWILKTSRPKQISCHFKDDTFKLIMLYNIVVFHF